MFNSFLDPSSPDRAWFCIWQVIVDRKTKMEGKTARQGVETGSIHLATSLPTRDTVAMAARDHRLRSWLRREGLIHGATRVEVKH